MENAKKQELAVIAEKIRLGVIEGTFNAKSGHPGGSLSIAELLAYLYFDRMNVDPQNPKWQTATVLCCQRDTLHRRCMPHCVKRAISRLKKFKNSATQAACCRVTPI